MTKEAGILAIVEALGLPSEARLDARVPKKLLVEQGAPTAADKRAIQDGIDELRWLGACKPATIGVPAYADDLREYLEIAIVGCAFRLDPNGKPAKVARLIELIHRAIPYPVLLVTSDEDDIALSAAHKRHAQNEADKVVVERVVFAGALRAGLPDAPEQAFIDSLALVQQPRRNLWALYEGWVARIEALVAARLSGRFEVRDESGLIDRRRTALDEHARLAREAAMLRVQAARAKQIAQRVDLNQKIKAVETAIDRNKKLMMSDGA